MAGGIQREHGFLFSVGAEQELARLCPGGDLKRLGELMTRRDADAIGLSVEMICILSRWHEKARALEEPGYEPRPLTPEELQLLPMAVFAALQAEAMDAMRRDAGQTVEAEPAKKAAAPKSS